MGWQYTPFTVPLVAAALAALGTWTAVATKAWGRRLSPEVALFQATTLGAAVWTGGYLLRLSSTDLTGKLFWTNLMWVGVVTASTAWPLFVLVYTGHDRWAARRRLAALAVVPAVTLLGVWTTPLTGLFIHGVGVDSSGGIAVLTLSYGPLFWLFVTQSYVLSVLALVAIAAALRAGTGAEWTRHAILLVACVVPALGSVVSVGRMWPTGGVDLLPLSYLLVMPLLAWGVVRHRLLDLAPVGRARAFETLRDGVLIVDADGVVVDANRAARQFLRGDPAAVLEGLHATDFADRCGVLPELLTDLPTTREVEMVVGDERRLLEVDAASIRDAHGDHVGTLVTCRDHTERRRVERRFQTLIEKSSTLICIVDADGTFTYASPSHETVLGYDPEALVGRNVLELVHADDQDAVTSALERARHADGDRQLTVQCRTADGNWRTLDVVADVLIDDPDIGGIVVRSQDVTDEQRFEQRLRVLNRVLRHDLRNDMNVVAGHAALLAEHEDPAVRESAAVVAAKADDLVDLSEKARDVEASLVADDERVELDVATLLRRRLTLLRNEWPAADVRVDLPEQAWVVAHPLLSSALDNVLENAVEHNDAARPRVHVSLSTATRHGLDYVDVRVDDDGPGVPRWERRVIETENESALEHASGLGLWLVNWVVAQSGGDLHIGDRSAGGTSVRLSLRVAEGDGAGH